MILGYCSSNSIHPTQRRGRHLSVLTLFCCMIYWQTKAFIGRTVSAFSIPPVFIASETIAGFVLRKYSIRFPRESRLHSNSISREAMDNTSVPKSKKNIVVVGGGIQGAAVSYYLSQMKDQSLANVHITVLEAVSIASAASGKGGGFMAKTWGAGTPTQALHEEAFDLYEQLAVALNCTSYRKLPVLSVTPQSARRGSSFRTASNSVQSIFPDWLDPDKIGNAQVMGTGSDTAQITPSEVTEKMLYAAQATLVFGRCNGIELQNDGKGVLPKVTGVRYIPKNKDGSSSSEIQILPADQIVVCAGPWSCSLVDWIPQQDESHPNPQLLLPMEGIKSTSIVFPPPSDGSSIVDATALFCGEDDRYNTHLEVYPRPDGTVYICGIGGSDYVSTGELRKNSFLFNCPPNEQRVEAALSAFQSMVSARSVANSMQSKAELDRTQACMRPCPPDAMPYMGAIPGYDGLYINAGHNCWGIAWAPACGLAMAELLMYGESKTIDLSPFYPARFTPSLAKDSRGRKKGNTNVGEQW